MRAETGFINGQGMFFGHLRFWLPFLILFLLSTLSLSAPLISLLTGQDASSVNLLARFAPVSGDHWLGTDELGRDHLLRLLYGGRLSLSIALAGALVTAFLGVIIGLFAGYFGGWTDAFLMRLADSILALPILPLLIVMAAIDLEKLGIPSALSDHPYTAMLRIIVIIALFGWPTIARLVRASVLSLKERDFIRAATALGSNPARLIFIHLLPNTLAPVFVATSLTLGNFLLTESILSFLGLGVQPPQASWGAMLSNAQEMLWQAPQLAVLPGLLIFVTVISVNLIGDYWQDQLDPRRRKS